MVSIYHNAMIASLRRTNDRRPEKGKTVLYGRATFAGGCSWCMKPPFEKLDGIVSAVVGYTGGPTTDPTYQDLLTLKRVQRIVSKASREW